MTIKTFRGLLADGAQQEINLRTNTGKIAYRIHKFELMVKGPGQANSEHTVKIFTLPQATGDIDGIINFGDHNLLAAGIVSNTTAGYSQIFNAPPVIFDNVTFNQNIFITHFESHSNEAINYHLELEQIKLSDNESTMATLQSIRSRYESYTPAGPT